MPVMFLFSICCSGSIVFIAAFFRREVRWRTSFRAQSLQLNSSSALFWDSVGFMSLQKRRKSPGRKFARKERPGCRTTGKIWIEQRNLRGLPGKQEGNFGCACVLSLCVVFIVLLSCAELVALVDNISSVVAVIRNPESDTKLPKFIAGPCQALQKTLDETQDFVKKQMAAKSWVGTAKAVLQAEGIKEKFEEAKAKIYRDTAVLKFAIQVCACFVGLSIALRAGEHGA